MANKHTNDELVQMQSLPLDIKVKMTQRRIREWYEHWDGEVYVSFSGGKDSTVLLHLVREMYPEVEAVYSDTGLEYPEIREFVREFDNVTWLKPEMNFKQVIKEKGYPVISKEVSNNLDGARKYIAEKSRGGRQGSQHIPYDWAYRRIQGIGEYSKRRLGKSERLSSKTCNIAGDSLKTAESGIP